MITQETIRAYIKMMLGSNTDWAIRGMLKIYELQTIDEQATRTTHTLNSVGFSGCDAEIMSSLVTFYKRFNRLSDKQMKLAFKKMPRYHKQILKMIPKEKMEQVRQAAQCHKFAEKPQLNIE